MPISEEVPGNQEYWAAKPDDEFASDLKDAIIRYYRQMDATGRSEVWRRSVRTYYGLDSEGSWRNSSAITYGGEQGELVMLRVNHYRNLIQHMLTMTTASRPSFSARAMNDDQRSLAQARIAEGLIDYYLDEYNLEHDSVRAVEFALVFGEGWLSLTWDTEKGDQYGVEQVPVTGDDGLPVVDEMGMPVMRERIVYSGDISTYVSGPMDVVRDIAKRDNTHDWLAQRMMVNRYDLMERYPDRADDIENMEAKPADSEALLFDYVNSYATTESEDIIPVYYFYHKPTEALPLGRFAIMAGDILLHSGRMPYSDIPIYPLIPSVQFNTSSGYSGNWDLLALSQAMDSLITTAMTNHEAFGVQNVLVPYGSDIEVNDLSGGLRMVQFNAAAGEPKPLELLSISQHTYQMMGQITEMMETLSGVNSVARGNPEKNLDSGAALALVHSMAIQYNNGLQRSYGRMMEKAVTGLVRMLQQYASTPRLAEVLGANERPNLIEFTGDDIASVRRVKVDLSSPLLRTAAGRVQLADRLLERQAITAQQYLDVVATGRLNPILDGPRAELSLIKSENDLLSNGVEVRATPMDNHRLHIQEHKVILADPELRFNDELVGVILSHIKEHVRMAQEHPEIMLLTGQEPVPGSELPPEQGNVPEGAAPAMGGPDEEAAALGEDPTRAKMPEMPKNPLTGQRYNPQGGMV
ncbi:MAG: hypothetical protein CMQ40_01885 [Gammaproteobacteria bacterium]|nr:hypothetical protein [Gammaproteobacteria bacterium]